MITKATRIVVIAVVGAALILGLLAIGTVTMAGPPPGPPPGPPKPEPPPEITPGQIVDGVNQLMPMVKGTPKNRLPSVDAARSYDDGSYLLAYKADRPAMLAFPREVRLFAARSLDDALLFGRRAGVTPLGAIELGRDYKLGVKLPPEMITKGRYGIAAIYDKENKIDAEEDPKNEIDFWLILVGEDKDGDSLMEIAGFIGLPHKELARVMGRVDVRVQIEFAVAVLLNLVAALLQ